MVDAGFEVKTKGLVPEKFAAKSVEIREAAYKLLGVHFHEVNLPRRFTWSGGKMLGYQDRKPKYTAIKRQRKGHVNPLSWSGTSEKLATKIQDVRVKARGSKTEVRVVIHARGLNLRSKHTTIRMNDEVRRIAAKEYGPLTRVLEAGFKDEIKKRDSQ